MVALTGPEKVPSYITPSSTSSILKSVLQDPLTVEKEVERWPTKMW